MELKDQLTQVQTQLAEEKAKGGDRDAALIGQLEEQEAKLLNDIMLEEQKQQEAQLQQAHDERVTQSVDSFYSKLDNYDFGDGKTLRSIITSPAFYTVVSIGLKQLLACEVDPLSKQLGDLQKTNDELSKSNDDLRAKLANLADDNAKLADDNQKLKNDLYQEQLERDNAEKTKQNAVSQLEEANKEVERLNGHVEDLRQQIALGVPGALKVINSAEEEAKKAEALAEIKRQYTVYDEQPADFKRSKFTAKRAIDDSVVEYTNLEKPSYTVIDEAQVTQFRSQYPIVAQNDHADSALDQPVQAPASVTPPALPEVTQFPEVPTPTIGLADQEQGVHAEGAVTREEFEALKKRVEVIEAHANISGRVA